MNPVSRAHRIFFALVGSFALWVGLWGYLVPGEIVRAIPWDVPPLHARFIGAMYLSGMVLMGLALIARRVAEVQVAVIMAAMWTGMLLLVSLLHLGEFDYSRPPVWFWFGAYIAYPLMGAWLAWARPPTKLPDTSAAVPPWARVVLAVQGVVCVALAACLLFLPNFMVSVWPWRIPVLLAQIYSGPFLSFGVGGLLLARRSILDRMAHRSGVDDGLRGAGAGRIVHPPWPVRAGRTGRDGLVWWLRDCDRLAGLPRPPLNPDGKAVVMHLTPTRAYTWIASTGLFLQGTITLIARLVPAVDRAVPFLLAETHMVPAHSVLHIVSGLIGFALLRFGGSWGSRIFALGFGLFYAGLGVSGALTGEPVLLHLIPFDHPFHVVVGGAGLLAVAVEWAMTRRNSA